LIARNVAGIAELRRRSHRRRSRAQRFSDAVFGFAGGLRFVVVHLVWFALWIGLNTGVVPGVEPWDPWPFVALATLVSLEAIVLGAIVIASQNRAQRLADQRADLDLQINLLAEHEITRILQRVDAIAERLGVELDDAHEVEALKQELAPSNILRALVREADDDDDLIHPDHDGSGEHTAVRPAGSTGRRGAVSPATHGSRER
jgi:uncharacterized membrane protein